MTLALALAGVGVVIVLGTWIGVVYSDAADRDREAVAFADLFTGQLDAQAQLWRRGPR